MMKIIGTITAICFAGALTGCQSVNSGISGITLANNGLATLAQYDLPVACGIVQVAEGYFEQLKPNISVGNQNRYLQAKAAAASICTQPYPTNVGAAFYTLLNAWTAIQNATKVMK